MCGILCAFGLSDCNCKASVLKGFSRLTHRGPDWTGVYEQKDTFMGHHRLMIVGSLERGNQPLVLATPNSRVICVANGEIYNHQQLRGSIVAGNLHQEAPQEQVGYQEHAQPAHKVNMQNDDSKGMANEHHAQQQNGNGHVRHSHACTTANGNGSAANGWLDHSQHHDEPSPASALSPAGMTSLAGAHVYCQSDSDCEVLLRLFNATEGDPKFPNFLNGAYAFMLYEESTGRYVVGRDHIGIVPLYLGVALDGSMWFASELKALTDCALFWEFPPGHVFVGPPKERYIPSQDQSVLERLAPVATGDHLWQSASTMPEVLKKCLYRWFNPRWYDESFVPPPCPIDLIRLRTEFEAAVKRRLMCDVPYGVLLSGGLDSSLVAAIVVRHARVRQENPSEEAHWPRVHSFSIGLEGSPDLLAARKAAAHLGTVHHECVFTIEEGLSAISEVIRHIETFDVTTIRASTPMFLLARRIKALGIKMVLSGEGSDEVFGGYLYFHKAPNAEEFHKESVRKVKALNKFDCLRANKSTMSWGVEPRVPFLDVQFLEYAMAMDPREKMVRKERGGIEKWILRKAFEGYLPDDILWRQKEQFSDGVGYNWINSLKAHAEKAVSDAEMQAANQTFPIGTPTTKEAYYYRKIFQSHYPQPCAALCVPTGPSIACSTPTAILWDEAFKKAADPSGRAVAAVHLNAQ